METLVKVSFGFTENLLKPIYFQIIFPVQESENSGKAEDAAKAMNNILCKEKDEEIERLKEAIALKDTNINEQIVTIQNLTTNIKAKSKQIEELKSEVKSHKKVEADLRRSVKDHEQTVQELSEIKKKIAESEKIKATHFEVLEEFKAKHQEDILNKTAELERKLVDCQKALNLKTNQAFKLSQTLKDREQRRTSAEVMLDEQEKKNNELIEKSVKQDKTILDLEKRLNELNRRLSLITAELKANDEVLLQRDTQMKKLLAKLKYQETELQRLSEENLAKEKRISEFMTKEKKRRNSVEVDTGTAKEGELKRALKAVAEKEDEIQLMKEMMKSIQIKHQSPAVSSKFTKQLKLPPLAGSSSDRVLSKKEPFRTSENIRTRFAGRHAESVEIKGLKSPEQKKSFAIARELEKKLKSVKEDEILEHNLEESKEDHPEFKDLNKDALLIEANPKEKVETVEEINKDHSGFAKIRKHIIYSELELKDDKIERYYQGVEHLTDENAENQIKGYEEANDAEIVSENAVNKQRILSKVPSLVEEPQTEEVKSSVSSRSDIDEGQAKGRSKTNSSSIPVKASEENTNELVNVIEKEILPYNS